MVLLCRGEVVADGRPEQVVNRAMLRDVFRVEAPVDTGRGGRPWIHYDEA
jgi:ABC-type cobalamin/Fe3+-siderophores transport system ATPase subunit